MTEYKRIAYSVEFIEMLTEYVGPEILEMEAHTRVEWTEGLFSSFKLYLDLPGKRMLDAGCGHGVLALGAHLQGMQFDGFDIVAKAVIIANRRLADAGAPSVTFQHDIRQSVPEGFTEAFDLVKNFQVLEHIPRVDQFTVIRNLCQMVKPGGFLFIDTENSLFPYDRHDTQLPLVRLLAPAFQQALVGQLGKGINFYEPSFEARTDLHDYLSYDEIIGATQALGFDVVDSVIPHRTMQQLFQAMTGSNWFYDTIARYFECERFLPVSALFRKRAAA